MSVASAGLLGTLETVAHGERQRRMIEFGALSADAATVLAELARGNGYDRRLVLQAALGSRDGALAARALADPSRQVRQTARPIAAELSDDGELRSTFAALPVAQRRGLLSALRRRRRTTAIDGILRALDDTALIPLLHLGGPALVAERLAELSEQAGLDWPALARAHPDAVAAHFVATARTASVVTERLLRPVRAALDELSDRVPDAVLTLLGLLASHGPIVALLRPALMYRRPAALAELCIGHVDGLPFSFAPVADRLEPSMLSALLDRFGGLGGWRTDVARWFRRLRPDRRGAVFALAGRGWRNAEGIIPLPILLLLPADARRAEAARHLALPALLTRPLQRLPYAALLAWREARAEVDAALRDPEAELRVTALQSLIGCVRFDRDRADDALDLAVARRYEQDPVREGFLRALADLPPVAWHVRHLNALATVARHALDAADLSPASALQLERLLAGLLGRHPEFASEQVATLARERGALGRVVAVTQRPMADLRPLIDRLMPVLDDWFDRERDGEVIATAASFGDRMRAWNGLADMLERLIRRTASTVIAASGLATLARTRPDRVSNLVPALLAEDPTWIIQPAVRDHLHRHRQDLLTPYLGQVAYAGRFATGLTWSVPAFTGGFHRWTPTQQAHYCDSLTRLIADAPRDNPTILWAVRALAAMPDIPPGPLERIASDDTRPSVRDAALRGLGRRDAGDGLPTLIAALDDSRARIAAYALRRCLGEMPTDRALATLAAIPLRAVTVAKEIVRLVGDLPGDAAYAWLLARDADDRAGRLHRDVRIALLRGLWSRLDRDETWTILQRAAAADDDAAVAASVARLPSDRLSEAAGMRFAKLLGVVLTHPDWRARSAALSRANALPAGDPEAALRPVLLDAMASSLPDERRLAIQAFLAVYGEREAARLGEATTAALADRERLETLLEGVRFWAAGAGEQRAPAVLAVLGAITVDPVPIGRGIRLAVAALPEKALIAHFWATLDRLHADALCHAVAALERPRTRSATALETIEAALAGADDERLRRIALAALLGQASTARGWTDARLARLDAFRADVSPLVAEAAQFTFPADRTTGPPSSQRFVLTFR